MNNLTMDVTIFAKLDKTMAMIQMKGKVDHSTIDGFRQNIETIKGHNIKKFIFELAKIGYINSKGITTLINLQDELKSKGGGLVLVNVTPQTKVVLKMLELDKFFKIFPNKEDAKNYLKNI